MKRLIFILMLSAVAAGAASKDDLLLRIKVGEAIFAERFSPARLEGMLSRGLEPELRRLEKGAGREQVARIRRIFSDVSNDVFTSTAFKDQYAGWLANELSKSELESYLEFLRSPLGKKMSDLDDRVQPLMSEAVQRRSKGRLESIPLLLAEARSQ